MNNPNYEQDSQISQDSQIFLEKLDEIDHKGVKTIVLSQMFENHKNVFKIAIVLWVFQKFCN